MFFVFSKSFWPIIVWQLFYFGCKKGIFLREIGQCFGELYLKKGYVLFKYINLFFLSIWDQTGLLFIFFSLLFNFLWYQKRAGLLNDDDFFFQIIFHFIFSQLFFSVAVMGFFWLLKIHLISFQLISFLSFCFFGVVQSLFTKLCTTEIMNAMRWWNAFSNFRFFSKGQLISEWFSKTPTQKFDEFLP